MTNNTIALKEGYLYDFHFKAWNYDIKQLELMIRLHDVHHYIAGDKFIFEKVKYHKVLEMKILSNGNGSIFFIDAEYKGCSLEYNFSEKKGMFDAELVEKIQYFLSNMEKKNQVDCYSVNHNKLSISVGDYEFSIIPNSTESRVVESNFAMNTVMLLIKKYYSDSFNLSVKNGFDMDFLSSIKYINKWLKTHFRVSKEGMVA